jgi:hypothetical protein
VLAHADPKISSGFAHSVDVGFMVRSLLGLGLWKRPWEGLREPTITGVGLFDSEHFDPGRFRVNMQYYPFQDRDRFDAFWGSKILIRFTPEMIRAVVEEARFSDPRAVEYLTRVLIERQRKVASYWFERVNPLDRFALERRGDQYRLCFDDLTLRNRLQTGRAKTTYLLTAYGYDGAPLAPTASLGGDARGRGCFDGIAPGPTHEGYAIARIVTRRGGKFYPPVLVHMATDPATGELRIIGLRRW